MGDDAQRARRRAHNAHALERCNAMGRTAGSILWQPLRTQDGKWFMPDGSELSEPPIEWRSERLSTILDEMDALQAVAPVADPGKAYVESLDAEKWKASVDAQFFDGGAVRLDLVETHTPGPDGNPYGWTEIGLVKTVIPPTIVAPSTGWMAGEEFKEGDPVFVGTDGKAYRTPVRPAPPPSTVSLEQLEKSIMEPATINPFSGGQKVTAATLHPSTFEYLKPTDEQVAIMAQARGASANYAATLDALLPPGPDKTFLLRQLREVAMWVNIAITRNADGSPRT